MTFYDVCFFLLVYPCPVFLFHFLINITTVTKRCQLLHNNVFDIKQFSLVEPIIVWIVFWYIFVLGLYLWFILGVYWSSWQKRISSHITENFWNVLVEKYYKLSSATPLVPSRHVNSCYGYQLCLSLFLRCFDWILELLQQCGIFVFHFIPQNIY